MNEWEVEWNRRWDDSRKCWQVIAASGYTSEEGTQSFEELATSKSSLFADFVIQEHNAHLAVKLNRETWAPTPSGFAKGDVEYVDMTSLGIGPEGICSILNELEADRDMYKTLMTMARVEHACCHDEATHYKRLEWEAERDMLVKQLEHFTDALDDGAIGAHAIKGPTKADLEAENARLSRRLNEAVVRSEGELNLVNRIRALGRMPPL